ncbi:MAG: T9SS type A sorting domain-containing protein [Ignavibacteriaceae bacterium]|nr:T9SS type A sorting domain-containing protein [Ignavibacteria bacterium]MBT8391469.1 T9SS type A sorting domain-containing protein [Ignavibacteria bacterium]NNJ54132.1 T9SS type A sorting domain-containing protein [Ignavibacteriaceae bacterium]
MKLYFIMLFVSFILSIVQAQQFTNWRNYTNMNVVKDLVITSTDIRAATGGGAFIYRFQDDFYKTLHKSEGLNGISLTSVTTDMQGKIWFGSADGVIDIYDTNISSFNVVLDIFNSNQTNKAINDLVINGDTLIASTDFGVSLINTDSFIFFDTFLKFGTFPSNTKVNSTLKTNLFYVCTDQGIAIQKSGGINLSAPESWDVYSSSDGLPSDKTYKANFFEGNLIVSTDVGFAINNGGVWSGFIPDLNNKNISDFVVSNDSIFIISESKLFIYTNNQLAEIYNSSKSFNKLAYNRASGFAIATNSGIISLTNNLSSSLVIPNSPPANQFPNMFVDNSSNLWSASGKDATGVGYYVFNGTEWQNYNTQNETRLPSNGVWSVYTSSDNRNYLGTWGKGFVEIEGDNFKTYNRENSGMQGIPQNPDFIVITGFDSDSRNNLWVLNYWAADRNTLSMKTSENNWYHFSIPAALNKVLEMHENLVIDQYDTKWFSSSDVDQAGLYYFNENKTFEDASDDRSEYISAADGLNTNDIRAIVVDRRGDVWVGTSLGVNVLTNTSTIPSSNDPLLGLSNVFTLRQQSINAMVVDPLNQKWVGTNEGLLFVNSDGSRLIRTFTTKNSPLLSDQIRSLAIDENAGIVYVGTDNGLTSFETPYIKPLEEFDELFVYPNPFILKDKTQILTIDGLIRDSEIKVLNLNGTLVTEFLSPGGRTAFWDGTDLQGELVNSGVYIIVAFDSEGNNVTTSKVAVLRE